MKVKTPSTEAPGQTSIKVSRWFEGYSKSQGLKFLDESFKPSSLRSEKREKKKRSTCQHLMDGGLNRTVPGSNILSFERLWQDVKQGPYAVSRCLHPSRFV